MVIKQATEQDFAYAFSFIEKLWDYNVYDKETVKSVFKEPTQTHNSSSQIHTSHKPHAPLFFAYPNPG